LKLAVWPSAVELFEHHPAVSCREREFVTFK
jgi:hypothetical protein